MPKLEFRVNFLAQGKNAMVEVGIELSSSQFVVQRTNHLAKTPPILYKTANTIFAISFFFFFPLGMRSTPEIKNANCEKY